MNAERWKQIDEILDAVLEIPNERREEFLSEKCDGDDDLKREIESLLKVQKSADKFMEHSAMNLMAKEIAQNEPEFSSPVSKTLRPPAEVAATRSTHDIAFDLRPPA